MKTLTSKTQVSLDAPASRLSDEDLLLQYRDQGEPKLFEQLVGRYERELYSYLRRYLGNAELAEDAFQGTFLQVHLKSDQFEAGRRFRPWLYTIATNQAIDARRRDKRHRMVSLDRSNRADDGDEVGKLVDLLISGDVDPHEQVDETERRQRVQTTLDSLPESMQTVIHLVYYQGLKYREAAEALAVPVGTIKSRLHAAIQKLTEVWRESHAEQV